MNVRCPKSYVPTLAIRPSEMKGLEFLDEKSKNRITPCILFAPWVGSRLLDFSIKRVEEAFPNRPYILDINRDYQPTNPKNPAQQEFTCLSDSINNWIEIIKKSEQIIPCIQFEDKNEAEIRQQIKIFQELGRKLCIRIEFRRRQNDLDKIISVLKTEGQSDLIIILEGGWVNDALSLFVEFEGLITEGLRGINPEVPIVISCTSILKSFSGINGVRSVRFHNRELVKQIQQKLKHYTIIYGDWGSTYPRKNNTFGRRGSARIDYPIDNAWYIARNPNKKWDFKIAAKEIIRNSEVWKGSLKTSGERLIHQTATHGDITGRKPVINSLQQNMTARINIHLYRQALYEERPLYERDPIRVEKTERLGVRIPSVPYQPSLFGDL